VSAETVKSGAAGKAKRRKGPKGIIEIFPDECKGCGYCVEECPMNVLMMSEKLNRKGYHPSVYVGDGCSGCGICFYACPEPGAIRVRKIVEPKPA
jgi:NAD-dependent dihydropyrimidine dehydrogenase PreA subunit